mgnify:CR=1 FL=1
MELNDQINMDNIKYCVNHKGQKIKPYKNRLKPIPKSNLLKRVFNCIFNRNK